MTVTEYIVFFNYGGEEAENELFVRLGDSPPQLPPAMTLYDREQAVLYCLSIQHSILDHLNMFNIAKATPEEMAQGYFNENGLAVEVSNDIIVGFILVTVGGERTGYEVLCTADEIEGKAPLSGMRMLEINQMYYWWKFVPAGAWWSDSSYIIPDETDPSSKDSALFNRLKELRLSLAHERGVRAFMIFHDRTLEAMVARRPKTATEFAAIPGVGPVKLAEFGDAFIGMIREFEQQID